MTIETITVHADFCFGDQPVRLDGLKKVNFVFAPNGAGKSTISNRLAQQPKDPHERAKWDVAPTSLPIRVFNEAYRSKVLTEHIKGIFTIGEESEKINAEISQLQQEVRNRSVQQNGYQDQIGSVKPEEGLRGKIEATRCEAMETVFAAHKDLHHEIVQIVFKGYRNDRAKFFAEALRRFKELETKQPSIDWQPLITRAQSLTGQLKSRKSLPGITTRSLVSAQDIKFVSSDLESRGEGPLSDLIQHLNNDDWVSDGRKFIEEADGKCPFCQTVAPPSLEDNLNQYFSAGYDIALRRAIEIEESVRGKAQTLDGEILNLKIALNQDENIHDETFTTLIESIQSASKLTVSVLSAKVKHPTQSHVVSDTNELITQLLHLVAIENCKISQHNQLVSASTEERLRLVDEGWEMFLSERHVSSEIRRFQGIRNAKEKLIANLQEEISQGVKANQDANSRIAELRNSISNTAQVAENINNLLRAMGFHRFHLAVAGDAENAYRITRKDGTQAYNSLSEGEKSFICFAYFWESLFGTSAANEEREDVIAIIDDPISSLDSDALFMIAAYIRDAASHIKKGDSNLRQLVVLTHNTQFHHEASYTADSNPKDRTYFRLIKGFDGRTSAVCDGAKSKIRGSYALLWSSVVEAVRNNNESDLVRVGVFNIVRRILEGYFRTVGAVQDYKLPTNATLAEKRIMSQFHIWANSGSHSITDDVDQTIDIGRTNDFLRQFREYFRIQGHEAHFDMMIKSSDGADLLELGQIFGRERQ